VNTNRRIALAVAVLVAAAVGFLIARSASDSGTDTTTPAATTGAASGGTTAAKSGAAAVTLAAITVAKGQAVGGVKEVSTAKGAKVAITVSSPDYAGEIHLHGYDIKRDVAPGKPAQFDFSATQEGVFDMEVEATSTQIAKLTVNP